jgi:uncharacterized protein YciI
MMNKRLPLLLAIACFLIAVPLALAQQKEPSPSKLVEFHMAIVKKGPKWSDRRSVKIRDLHQKHFKYVLFLLDSGKAVLAGDLSDRGDLRAVFIYRAQSAAEARAWAENDPEVKAGQLTAEMHPWWSEDIFKKADSPLKIDTVYLAFLKRGPNRKEGDGQTPEVQELQKAHIANIVRLANLKKIIAAGPFGDDGALRGIFVFRVASLQEAQALCATDPMIKIGRLAVELHPWQVPVGVLP